MKTCVLCEKESENVEAFKVTDEARAMMEKHPGSNAEEPLSQTGVCKDCLALPAEDRMELANKAMGRIIKEAVLDVTAIEEGTKKARERGRFRIDIARTIDAVTFPPEVWSWIDLLGEVLIFTQREITLHEGFVADTTYKRLLVRAINRDLSSLNAIYILLRLEFIHQAAALVRMLCESIITLRYIAKDLKNRVQQFLDYYHVEVYEIAVSTLEHERSTANPDHVKNMEDLVATLRPEYNRTKPRYVRTGGKKKPHDFVNWCDASMLRQARDCGDDLTRLYDLVYSQLSAYVHGSAWSLRRQIAYSRVNYDATTVLIDIATVVRTAIYVWQRRAIFCDEQLGWKLSESFPEITARLARLDSELEPGSP